MKDEWLGRRRKDWVAYLRGVAQERETRRAADDGMSHGIIPLEPSRCGASSGSAA